MKLGGDGALEAPSQPVRDADQQGATPAEQALGEARDRKHRHREQHVLGNQESQGRRKDPIDRTEERQDRVKVVPEEVVARTFDGNDGRLEARVRLDCLGEDTQVPGGDDEGAPLGERVAHVEGADRERNRRGNTPGGDDARDPRSACAPHPTISAGRVPPPDAGLSESREPACAPEARLTRAALAGDAAASSESSPEEAGAG